MVNVGLGSDWRRGPTAKNQSLQSEQTQCQPQDSRFPGNGFSVSASSGGAGSEIDDLIVNQLHAWRTCLLEAVRSLLSKNLKRQHDGTD